MGFSPKQYRYIIIGMFLITLLILIEMEYTSRVPTGTFTETPRTISASSCSYLLSTDGNKVYAKNVSNGNIEFSGTLNEVLSFTAKSGNHICMKNGDYSLSTITLQPNVIIECESNNA